MARGARRRRRAEWAVMNSVADALEHGQTLARGGSLRKRTTRPPAAAHPRHSVPHTLTRCQSLRGAGSIRRAPWQHTAEVLRKTAWRRRTFCFQRQPARGRLPGRSAASALLGPDADKLADRFLHADPGRPRADVIKVEEPRIGDPTRRNVPFIGDEQHVLHGRQPEVSRA